jgi:lysozyme
MDKTALMSALTQEEGFKPFLYDDATGKSLTQGSIIKGWPTIACGWNVAARPCTEELGQIILGYFVDQTWAELSKAIPWVLTLPDPVQRALADMAYNEGVNGLLKFNTFLAFIQKGEYDAAATDLGATLWFSQVKSRGPRIQALIRRGAL